MEQQNQGGIDSEGWAKLVAQVNKKAKKKARKAAKARAQSQSKSTASSEKIQEGRKGLFKGTVTGEEKDKHDDRMKSSKSKRAAHMAKLRAAAGATDSDSKKSKETEYYF